MLGTPHQEWRKRAPAYERARTTLEEKVQLLSDKQRIEEMIHEYGFACDSAGWDVLQELYDENIEREMTGTLAEVVKGREKLIELHRNPVLPRAPGVNTVNTGLARFKNREIRHLISAKVIRISDDNKAAWALCYYQLAVVGQDDAGWQRGEHEGTYVFTFSKASGAWRFTQHLIWTNNAVNPMFGAPKTAA
jgi:hypothetical protein